MKIKIIRIKPLFFFNKGRSKFYIKNAHLNYWYEPINIIPSISYCLKRIVDNSNPEIPCDKEFDLHFSWLGFYMHFHWRSQFKIEYINDNLV